jgi:hypothetical protein
MSQPRPTSINDLAEADRTTIVFNAVMDMQASTNGLMACLEHLLHIFYATYGQENVTAEFDEGWMRVTRVKDSGELAKMLEEYQARWDRFNPVAVPDKYTEGVRNLRQAQRDAAKRGRFDGVAED